MLQLALPNSHNVPASTLQAFRVLSISLAIAANFLRPEFDPALWQPPISTTLVAVPKAAVYKDGLASASEDDVRFSGEALVM